MINRAKLEHILEYAKQQRHIGMHCKVPPEDMVEILEMAMLQGADGNSPVIPDGWVACSERMPEAGDDMIVFTDDIVMSGISYSKKKGFYIQALEYDDDEPVDNVTHWMPLPTAPRQPG